MTHQSTMRARDGVFVQALGLLVQVAADVPPYRQHDVGLPGAFMAL
jgi:hypothetical protein